MSDQDELNPAERELEAALRLLTPTATRLDPIAAAYSAGQRSARSEVRRWRVATATVALLGAGTWLLPAGRNLSGEKQVYMAVVAAVSPEMRPVPDQSMIVLRKIVWEKGVDGLAPVQLAPTKAMHINEIIRTHKGDS
jgi:hypothetical protein